MPDAQAPLNKASVILINGTSCSGKSSTAKFLRHNLDGEYHHIAWDDYVERVKQDSKITDEEKKDLFQLFLKQTCEKLDAGENLILDVVCVPTNTLQTLLDTYAPYNLYTVYIEAPPHILRERELPRQNRTNGQAEEQYNQIHNEENHPPYDIVFDSYDFSTREIGTAIIRDLTSRLQAQANLGSSRTNPKP